MNDEPTQDAVNPNIDEQSTPTTAEVKPKRVSKPRVKKAVQEGAVDAVAQAAADAPPVPRKRATRKKADAPSETVEEISAAGNAAEGTVAPVATVTAELASTDDLTAWAADPDAQQSPEGTPSESLDAQGEAGAAEGRRARRPHAPDTSEKAQEIFAEVLSEQFDDAYAEPPAVVEVAELTEEEAEHKRVLLPEPDAPKLHKVLAQSGVGSRRDMERLIEEGLVEVNDQVAHTGQRVSFGDQIKVRGKPVRVRIHPPAPRIIAYHKPAGEVVTHDDPQQRPTVFRHLPRLQQGKWQSVGRLDLNTEGLLLFTNNGELANQLMHPRFGVEREYAVRVLGTLEPEQKAKLLAGVEIEGQEASFKSIETGGGEGVNRWYRVVITEGRNREVRKLFDAVGLTVSRLIRIRYGTVVLPKGLKRGVWVDLTESDVRAIRALAGAPATQKGAQDGQARGPQGGRGPRDKRGQRGGQGPSEQGAGQRGERFERGDRQERADRPQRGKDRFEGRGPKPAFEGRGPRDQRGQGPGRRDDRPSRDVPRAERGDDWDEDFDPSRIPNPLEQTFDKRFVNNPRTAVGGKGFKHGYGGFGGGGSAPQQDRPKRGGPREPDPLQTSVGYIGADAFHRKSGGGGGGGRGGRGGGRRGGR